MACLPLQGRPTWRRVVEGKDITECTITGLQPFTIYEVVYEMGQKEESKAGTCVIEGEHDIKELINKELLGIHHGRIMAKVRARCITSTVCIYAATFCSQPQLVTGGRISTWPSGG